MLDAVTCQDCVDLEAANQNPLSLFQALGTANWPQNKVDQNRIIFKWLENLAENVPFVIKLKGPLRLILLLSLGQVTQCTRA